MVDLIHPRLLDNLYNFFASSCTIQRATVTISNYGEETLTWANVAALVSLPCALAPAGGREVKQADMTYVIASHYVTLGGNYAVYEKDRAIIGALTLDILLVTHDSQNETTHLDCQTVR